LPTEIKRFLNDVLQETLEPIRERRKEYQKRIPEVYQILFEGSKKARKVAAQTVTKVKNAIGINYFEDINLINEQMQRFSEKNNNS